MRVRYWSYFASLTAGALLMFWKGVPMYRSFLSGEMDPGNRSLLFGLAILLLIQPAYWAARRLHPPIAGGRTVAGHTVLFFGRMTFAFVTGVFSAVFYTRFGAMHFDPWRLALLVAVLFSMFCVTQEVDRLGQAMTRPRADS